MFTESILTAILKRRMKVSEKLMTNLLIDFIKEKLNNLYDEMMIYPKPEIKIEINDDCKKLGFALGDNVIKLSKTVINKLCNGEISYMNVVFHEIYHIKQFCQIESGKWNDATILYLEDAILNEVENRYNNRNDSLYLKKNYDVESSEYYAYLNGNLETIAFFDNHKIRLTRRELERLKRERKKFTTMRYVGGNKMYGKEYMDIHDAMDFVLLVNSEWTKEFPILREESKKRKRKV